MLLLPCKIMSTREMVVLRARMVILGCEWFGDAEYSS